MHISYADGTANSGLKYATNLGGSWVYTILDSAGWAGWESSIAIDSAGKVHISYIDTLIIDLKYATDASGSWVCTILDSAGWVGEDTSIAIDSADKVHISYRDQSNGALKYATVIR